MNEIWKPIKGYEGKYEVSSLGNVRSLDRNVYKSLSDNRVVFKKGKLLKQFNNYGYKVVHLSKNNKNYKKRVHRLVAEAFLDNPNNYKYVNHKDENKSNNNVNNLEWCDSKYNNNYGTRTKKYKKAIIQYDTNINFIKKWNSATDIQENLGYKNTCINNCCRGRLKTAYGYIWRYVENENN